MENKVNDFINKIATQDSEYKESLVSFFEKVTGREEEVKINFLYRLGKNSELFKSFMLDISGEYDANKVFNDYQKRLLDSKFSSDEDASDFVGKVASLGNIVLHSERLDIPVINGFDTNINDGKNPHLIISYSNNKGMIESLTGDGALEKDETFEDRIKLVNKTTVSYCKTMSMKNTEKNLYFLKDYKAIFDFKVYVHDIIMEGNKYMKTIYAYFVEPKLNDFYQLSLSAGVFSYDPDKIEFGKLDEDNEVYKILIDNLEYIMDNLNYKKK